MKEYNSYVMMVGKGMAGVKPEKEKKVYKKKRVYNDTRHKYTKRKDW